LKYVAAKTGLLKTALRVLVHFPSLTQGKETVGKATHLKLAQTGFALLNKIIDLI
jgi:hypothetical protein